MNTTFVNRANTNAKVYEEASKIAYPSDDDSRTVKPFSRYYAEKKASLLGHILRASDEDPLRQVSFQPGTAYRVQYGKKRIGKPRQNWIHQAKQFVYVDLLHLFSYSESKAEDNRILQHAASRRF